MCFDLSPFTSQIVFTISLPNPERKATIENDNNNTLVKPFMIIPPKMKGIVIEIATIRFPINPRFFKL